MALHPIFILRSKATPGIVELLDSVVFGTNGAYYKHLDTKEKIERADNPLFLSMERHEKTLGNITFCKREKFWYIRYFAFSKSIQSAGKTKSKSRNSGLLKRELGQFFEDVFDGEYGDAPDSFYAYIDPQNEKSLWMSENFGFQTIAKIKTQTFSRGNPKEKIKLERSNNWNDVSSYVLNQFGDKAYFFNAQVSVGPYYIWRDDFGEIVGFAKVSYANWRIDRFPGKLGGVLTKLIPFIPILNKIIVPKNHNFIVPEAVYTKDATKLGSFFESILFNERKNLIIWWVDLKDPMYMKAEKQTKWGVLNKIIGNSIANVVVKINPKSKLDKEQASVYTSGFDLI
ncbi:MAG: hypothetical protein MK105_05415 [Crocinitomicaceae bacterium]|nr:hypothetical protein [Crocinitomicaceae bacterium]